MKSILEFLENTAQLYPNKVAISTIDKNITFSELQAQAKNVSELLKDIKDSKQNIGVFSTQSIETLISFFAITYSGNTYVMLDPNSPIERVNTIINNANINYILKYENGQFILENINQCDTDKSNEEYEDDILYIVYTSGSTGIPKGVAKSHLSMIDFVQSFAKEFDITSDDIIANQTPFYFDASAKDIYTFIYTGATLVLVPKEYFSMPAKLIEYLNNTKTTIISWVPSALSIVAQLNTFNYIKPTTLQKVLFVGEVFPVKYLNVWIRNLPNLKYYNLYGASEVAGVVCYFEIDKELEETTRLPIGKSFGNANVFLLDGNGNKITDKNVEGELCISGPILASGYYGDKEKTKKVFVETKVNDKDCIIYKSGDLASINDDGNFVYHCRNDYQIKHMGQRIELGEIEAVCNSLPMIKECCCLYDDEKKKIMLFYSNINDEDNSQEIKANLKQLLPSYMVPNKLINLKQIPKNANGKINRTLLKNEYILK